MWPKLWCLLLEDLGWKYLGGKGSEAATAANINCHEKLHSETTFFFFFFSVFAQAE